MKQILLVEDDSSLQTIIKDQLGEAGYEVFAAGSKEEARKLIHSQNFDLAVIDVGLPDGSGFSLAPELNKKDETPFIFLTAMNSAESRLNGFEIGAIDYMPKPFHMRELLLRIQKAIGNSETEKIYHLNGFTLNPKAKVATLSSGEEVVLSVKDFDLLLYLVSHRTRIVSREELIKNIFDQDSHPRSIDNSIVRLRQQLVSLGADRIRSIRGVGYQWVEPI